MAGFMIGNKGWRTGTGSPRSPPRTASRRSCISSERPAVRRDAARLAGIALYICACAPPRSKCRRAKVGALKVHVEVDAEDTDQRRHVRQRDGDVAVEAPSADQRGVQV